MQKISYNDGTYTIKFNNDTDKTYSWYVISNSCGRIISSWKTKKSALLAVMQYEKENR